MSTENTPSESPEEILRRMQAESMARIRKADEELHAAQYAFATGNFRDYIDKMYKQTQQRFEAEYERTMEAIRPTADPGDGEEGG